MNKMEIQNLLQTYYAMSTLKFSERMEKFDDKKRYESDAEYIYIAQQWAWLLWSECMQHLNIFRIIAMLSLSELCNVKKRSIIVFGDFQKKMEFISVVSEFDKGDTEESKIAHLCKLLADGSFRVEQYVRIENITEKQYRNLICVYDTLETLEAKIRQGVINWNITGIRRESIAEHVYSVQQLAWLMWLATNEKIDILKVVSMLSIHEVEETIIGDITPYSGITPEQKREMGIKAVKKVLGNLKQYEFMHSLINEFDDEKTPDAFFAHLCDKLDCDLTVKHYSDGGYCSIENATDAMKNNPKIQKLIADGAKTVADAFIMADEHMYVGTIFEEVLNVAKTCDVTTL